MNLFKKLFKKKAEFIPIDSSINIGDKENVRPQILNYKYWDAGARKKVKLLSPRDTLILKVEDEEGNIYLQYGYQISKF